MPLTELINGLNERYLLNHESNFKCLKLMFT